MNWTVKGSCLEWGWLVTQVASSLGLFCQGSDVTAWVSLPRLPPYRNIHKDTSGMLPAHPGLQAKSKPIDTHTAHPQISGRPGCHQGPNSEDAIGFRPGFSWLPVMWAWTSYIPFRISPSSLCTVEVIPPSTSHGSHRVHRTRTTDSAFKTHWAGNAMELMPRLGKGKVT